MAGANSWYAQSLGPAGLAGALRRVPDMPLVAWMVLLTLVLGMAGGQRPETLIETFNTGFGRALGEFALILLPSFVLAAALSRSGVVSEGTGRAFALASPMAGAGMICPDTAYAALAPGAERHKLDVAFGAYTGFKLLYPAGPLIVATGLGVQDSSLALWGIALAIPVWGTGVLWGRLVQGESLPAADQPNSDKSLRGVLATFAPFVLLAALLIGGALIGSTATAIDFLFQPKGALLAAAVLALMHVPSSERRACLDSAVRRTGALLLVIGAASAFGAVLLAVVPLGGLLPSGNGLVMLLGLFGLTVLFKLAQGSSMATFAAVAPVTAPLVAASDLDPVAAIFAICLGSFVAILPNDSFYWLVRRDALAQEKSELKAAKILASGALLQALVGLVLLLIAVMVMA